MASGAVTESTNHLDVESGRNLVNALKSVRRTRVKRTASAKGSKTATVRIRKPGELCHTDSQRQETLLYAQRTVWVNLQQIIESAIRQSLNQNYTAAKFLCEFAGVFAAADEEPPETPAMLPPTSGPEAMRAFIEGLAEKRPAEQ